MKNKKKDSVHADHIGFVISEILLTVGSILFLIAWITLSNKEIGYNERFSLLEMQRYGLALAISGILSMIIFGYNIANKSEDIVSDSSTKNEKRRKMRNAHELVDSSGGACPDSMAKNFQTSNPALDKSHTP